MSLVISTKLDLEGLKLGRMILIFEIKV